MRPASNRFELIAERKLRRGHQPKTANIDINGRDLRERQAPHSSLRSVEYRSGPTMTSSVEQAVRGASQDRRAAAGGGEHGLMRIAARSARGPRRIDPSRWQSRL